MISVVPGVITASEPSWIAPFAGLSPRCFGKLLTTLRRDGADAVHRGRPWSLPLEDRVLLVTAYWRTNLTLRQLAPLFGVSRSTAGRVINHLGPLLALRPRKRFAKNTVLIVDGTLVPTRDHTIAERSKTSHVVGWSRRCSGSQVHRRREGAIGVEPHAVLQTVVEAAEQFVEQVSESCGMAFSTSSPTVIVGSWSLRSEGCKGPHVPG